MIRFSCPKCSAKCSAPPEKAGADATCRNCQAKIKVPALPHPDDIPTVLPADAPIPLPAKRRTFLGVSLTGIAVTFFICCGCGLVLLAPSENAHFGPTLDAGAGETAKVGSLTISIPYARIGSVNAQSPAGNPIYSADSLLEIGVLVKNSDPTSRPVFRGWSNHYGLSLTDDIGNSYGEVSIKTQFGFTATPNGQLKDSAPVYGDKAVRDVLVFARPVPGAKELTLTLPLSNVGSRQRGSVRFKIPRSFIKGN